MIKILKDILSVRRIFKIIAICFILYVYPFLFFKNSDFEGAKFSVTLLIVILGDLLMLYNVLISYSKFEKKLKSKNKLEIFLVHIINKHTFTFDFFISEDEDEIRKTLAKIGIHECDIICLAYTVKNDFYDFFVFNLICGPLAVLMSNVM